MLKYVAGFKAAFDSKRIAVSLCKCAKYIDLGIGECVATAGNISTFLVFLSLAYKINTQLWHIVDTAIRTG